MAEQLLGLSLDECVDSAARLRWVATPRARAPADRSPWGFWIGEARRCPCGTCPLAIGCQVECGRYRRYVGTAPRPSRAKPVRVRAPHPRAAEWLAMRQSGLPVRVIAAQAGVSPPTIYSAIAGAL
jgi:hypothetical protein